jgi:YD repeat-containing protein
VNAAEVLRAARALIAKAWRPGGFAWDADGKLIGAHDAAKAVTYGIFGAVYYAAGGDIPSRTQAAGLLYDACGERSLIDWEDRQLRTQKQVLELFDRAIGGPHA